MVALKPHRVKEREKKRYFRRQHFHIRISLMHIGLDVRYSFSAYW